MNYYLFLYNIAILIHNGYNIPTYVIYFVKHLLLIIIIQNVHIGTYYTSATCKFLFIINNSKLYNKICV